MKPVTHSSSSRFYESLKNNKHERYTRTWNFKLRSHDLSITSPCTCVYIRVTSSFYISHEPAEPGSDHLHNRKKQQLHNNRHILSRRLARSLARSACIHVCLNWSWEIWPAFLQSARTSLHFQTMTREARHKTARELCVAFNICIHVAELFFLCPSRALATCILWHFRKSELFGRNYIECIRSSRSTLPFWLLRILGHATTRALAVIKRTCRFFGEGYRSERS